MGRREPFERLKSELPRRLLEERDIGYLDPGIEELLDAINSVPGLATTSTCTGRAAIVEAKAPWERGEAESRIVYKTHGPLDPLEIARAVSGPYCDLWLKIGPPIIHVRARSLDCAIHLLGLARRAGFKHSGIISAGGPSGVAVEIMSGAQVSFPLRLSCRDLLRPGAETELAGLARLVMEENRERLRRLAKMIRGDPGPCA